VIAALSGWHEQHEEAAAALESVESLPSHVLVEAYSVLTRLPGGVAVPATAASDVLSKRFSGPPLALSSRERRSVLRVLAEAGVFGGAAYDGLVGLEARAHDEPLATLDRRAQVTYQRLGVAFQPIPV
jgi:predicted nucleic acid-binding protein